MCFIVQIIGFLKEHGVGKFCLYLGCLVHVNQLWFCFFSKFFARCLHFRFVSLIFFLTSLFDWCGRARVIKILASLSNTCIEIITNIECTRRYTSTVSHTCGSKSTFSGTRGLEDSSSSSSKDVWRWGWAPVLRLTTPLCEWHEPTCCNPDDLGLVPAEVTEAETRWWSSCK